MIRRVNSKDIDDILDEIDDNEAKEQTKRQDIFNHFWNNLKRIFHKDAFDFVRSDYDSCKCIGLNLTYKQWGEIIDDVKSLDYSARYAHWKKYFKTMSKEYIDKFKHWHNLVTESVIREKGLSFYRWRFPRFQRNDVKLLVLGYCRSTSKSKNIAIINDIIHMLIDYFGVFNNNIKNLFHKWDQEETTFCVRSGIFSFQSLHFCLFFDKQEHNSIGDDRYMLKVEYIGSGKNAFSQCDVELVCIFKEKCFKSCCTLTIAADDYHKSENLFGGLTSQDFDDLLKMNSSTFTFDIYIKKVTFTDVSNNSIEHIGEELPLLNPIFLDESLYNTNYCSLYQWNLCPNQVNKIMKVKDNSMKELQTIIKSQTFMICGLKCQIWMYITIDSDSINFRIHFIGTPEKIYTLSLWYDIAMNNTLLHVDGNAIAREEFRKEYKEQFSFILQTNLYKQNFINLKEPLKSFTIYFHTVNAYDKHDNEIKLDTEAMITNERKLPMQTVKWKFENKLLEKWKQSSHISNFFSSPFNIGPFVFILELHPKRKVWGSWGKRYNICIVEMHLIKRPVNISKLTVHDYRKDNVTLFFQEMERECCMKRSWIIDYGPNDVSGGCYEQELLPVIAIDNLQENTPVIFNYDIEILSILNDKDEDVIFKVMNEVEIEEQKQIELNSFSKPYSQHLEYKIGGKFYNEGMCKGNEWCSEIIEMFGSKWIFRFEGRSVRMKLYRIDNPNNIAVLCLHCKCVLHEIEWASSKAMRFDETVSDIDDDYYNITFQQASLHSSEFENNEFISFRFELILFDVYDQSRNDITDEYKDSKIRTIEMKDNKYCCEWKIPSKMYNSQTSKKSHGSQFCSDIFDCFGCKMYICFIPCKKHDKNDMDLYVSLADVNVNISWLLVQFKFSIVDLKIEISKLRKVGNIGCRTVAFKEFSKRDAIENMENLIMKFEIELLYVCDKKGSEITNNFTQIIEDQKSNEFQLQLKELKMSDELETHKWEIEKIKESETYVSPFYKIKGIGIEYRIEFTPGYYTNICVCIKSLPTNIASISLMIMIDFRYNEDWIEYNATVSDAVQFEHNKLKLWLTNVVKLGKYFNLSAVLKVKGKVISVYNE